MRSPAESQFCEIGRGAFVLRFGETEINDNFDVWNGDGRFTNDCGQNDFSTSHRRSSEQAFQFTIILVRSQCRMN